MATTIELINNVRSRANIERTKHVTDDEIVTWLNDEGDEFYQKLISSRENYVTRKAQFTLGTTTFVRGDDEASAQVPRTINDLNPTFTAGLSLTHAPPSYYKIVAFIVDPQGPCTTGDTTFSFRRGFAPIATVTVPAGSTDRQSAFPTISTTFLSTDTLDISSDAGAGADWECIFTIVYQQFVAETVANAAPLPGDFLKPLYVHLPLDNGCSMPVLPLDSLADKSLIDEYRYWISDQSIRIYPETHIRTGPYDLEYVPRWQTLQLNPWPNSLMQEMDRFSEIICLGAASMAKLKRKMIDDAAQLRQKQNDMTASAIAAIPGRVGSPKKIPMPKKDIERRYGGQWSRIYRFP